MQCTVHPREHISFERFATTDGPAIALDGYVTGPTRWDGHGHATFDHHSGCDRSTTRATCEQVSLAVRARHPIVTAHATVHVNDPDPDVAFSWWLLTHPARVGEHAVEHLVTLEGMIDTLGGVCPCDPADLELLAWVCDPWAAVRPFMATASATDMLDVIHDTAERLGAAVDGRGGRIRLDDTYDITAERGRIVVIVEHHPLARTRLCAAGYDAYISTAPGPTPDTRRITIGRCSPFSPIDLTGVYRELARTEPGWGGSDLVGGSPRQDGSRLDDATLLDVLTAHG